MFNLKLQASVIAFLTEAAFIVEEVYSQRRQDAKFIAVVFFFSHLKAQEFILNLFNREGTSTIDQFYWSK